MRWLQDKYYLSYMDYVGTSVYGDIKKAFDAMVIELKWPYDRKRYTCVTFILCLLSSNLYVACRRFAQDIKFVLGAIALNEQEEAGAAAQKRQRRTDMRLVSQASTAVKPAAAQEVLSIYTMF